MGSAREAGRGETVRIKRGDLAVLTFAARMWLERQPPGNICAPVIEKTLKSVKNALAPKKGSS